MCARYFVNDDLYEQVQKEMGLEGDMPDWLPFGDIFTSGTAGVLSASEKGISFCAKKNMSR